MHRVFCIPSCPWNSSNGTLAFRKAIDETFSLRVDPQLLDFINEPNLKTFILAPIDEEEAKTAPSTIIPAIIGPQVTTAQGGMTKSTPMAAIPPSVAPPTSSIPIGITLAPQGSSRVLPRGWSPTLVLLLSFSLPNFYFIHFCCNFSFPLLFCNESKCCSYTQGVGSHPQQGVSARACKAP